MQQLSFYVDTELYIIKQYEEEINNKLLTDEQRKAGCYYKFNEKVLFRTDSKTQMQYFKDAVGGSIMKPNEARRKLDLPDGEGGDTLLANGSMVPLTMAGAAYTKDIQIQNPEQPEENDDPEDSPDKVQNPDESDNDKDGEE